MAAPVMLFRSAFSFFRRPLLPISQRASFVSTRHHRSGKEAAPADTQPNEKIEIPKTMLIAFNCNVCSTRNQKHMSHRAYTNGLVLIKCDGCKNLHLIADHLGWFSSPNERLDIEKILEAKGQTVQRLHVGLKDGDVTLKEQGTGPDGHGKTEGGLSEEDRRILLETLRRDGLLEVARSPTKDE